MYLICDLALNPPQSVPLLQKYKPKKALKSWSHHSHHWIWSDTQFLGLFCPFFFFFLNGGSEQVSTIQEAQTGDTSLCLLSFCGTTPTPSGQEGNTYTESAWQWPTTIPWEVSVTQLRPPLRSRLFIRPFRLHPLIKWRWPTLTNSKKKNTGDKTSCAYTEVINTNTHFCWPEWEQSCSYNSNH